ncbi:MAG: hypothetical protein ACJAUV_000444 [Flavobacteriales bacterium]|jgi:hypothetical protein
MATVFLCLKKSGFFDLLKITVMIKKANMLGFFFLLLSTNFYAQYCLPAVTCGNFIINTEIQDETTATLLNNPSSVCVGYSDYSNLAPFDLNAGQAYVTYITPNAPGSYQSDLNIFGYIVWVDFDQSGTFDNEESAFVYKNTASLATPITSIKEYVAINVPVDAMSGITRMRIKADFIGPNQNFDNTFACNNNKGEVEDYLVNIISPTAFTPACALNPSPKDTTDNLCNIGTILSFDPPTADTNPLKDPTGYLLSLWTDNGAIVYLEQDTNLAANTTFIIPQTLTPGDTMYWSVSPYNDSDTNKNCTVWYFVTAPDANPAPVIAVKGDVSRSVDVCSGVDALFGLTDANSTPYTSATYDWDGTDPNKYPLNDTLIADPVFNSTAVGTTYELALLVTDQYGCTGVDTVDVLVKPSAASGIISASNGTKICEGDFADLLLTGYSPGGVIEWKYSTVSPTGSLFTTGDFDDNHMAGPITQDVYYVAIVDLNGCLDSSNVFIEKEDLPFKPAITNSDLSFCDGDSILLKTVWPGPGTMEWNDAAKSTTQSIWVKESGNYVATGIGVNGCSNDSDPAAVVKNELPNNPIVSEISGLPCQGDTIQINVDIAGADSLFWFVNGMLSSTYNSSTDYNIRNDVSYQFVNKTSEGCISDTVDYSVVFGSAPNKPIVNILSNDSLQIIGNAATYYWYLGDGTLVSTETDSIFEPAENGNYFVVGGNGPCLSEPSDTMIVDLYDGITSINENEQIVVFPNPNSGNFNIKLLSRSTINIRDIYGKVVYHNEHYSGVVGIELNVTTGVYIMEVLTNQHLVTMTRVIVE